MADLKFEVTKWQPGIIETNLDDVEKVVAESLQKYKGLVVQESDIKDAKKTKAEMNALAANINSWRIKKEKEFMAPFQEKKDQCNRIVKMIKDTSNEIDLQLKEYKAKEDEAKKKEIAKYWEEIKPEGMAIPLEKVWDDKYLNATGIGKKWKEDLEAKAEDINSDLDVITNIIMTDVNEGNFVAEEYKKTLDLSNAINSWNAHLQSQRELAVLQERASQKAAEASQNVKAESNEQSSSKHEELQQAPKNGNSEGIKYWAEFRIEDATLDDMKEMTRILQNAKFKWHLLKNADGTPRKGNNAN